MTNHEGLYTFMDCSKRHVTPAGTEICDELSDDFSGGCNIFFCKLVCSDGMCPWGYAR
jgi:hypothetical protein